MANNYANSWFVSGLKPPLIWWRWKPYMVQLHSKSLLGCQYKIGAVQDPIQHPLSKPFLVSLLTYPSAAPATTLPRWHLSRLDWTLHGVEGHFSWILLEFQLHVDNISPCDWTSISPSHLWQDLYLPTCRWSHPVKEANKPCKYPFSCWGKVATEKVVNNPSLCWPW